jgi:hypothetical protein
MAMPMLGALVILPASATYHFVLMLVPMLLLVSSHLVSSTVNGFMIGAYILLGYLPYVALFRIANQIGVVFAFPRLLLVSFIFCLVSIVMIRQRAKTSVQA